MDTNLSIQLNAIGPIERNALQCGNGSIALIGLVIEKKCVLNADFPMLDRLELFAKINPIKSAENPKKSMSINTNNTNSNALVDVEFLLTLEKKGVDFMLKAAGTRVELFDHMVDQGWSRQLRGSWEEKSFLLNLQRKIKDKDRAIRVLTSVLKGATLPELNEALLGISSSGDGCALRFWLRDMNRHQNDGHDGEKWVKEVMACAVDIGMDFGTEFSHKAEHAPSAKHTILSSFVSDLCHPGAPGQTYFFNGSWPEVILKPIHLIMEVQKVPDKQSIVQPLKYMNDEDCTRMFALFEEKGNFSATRALQMVARSKIPSEKLAPLQVRAAREVIDEMMLQTLKKPSIPAP